MRLPGPTDRTLIVGSTGSGKTRFGVWLSSTRNYDERPLFIFDYKRDDLIAQIPGKIISINKPPPTEPGIYILQPLPMVDDAAVERFLWKVWANERVILYFDEAYMVGTRRGAPNAAAALAAILTQGRSKYIEVISLSQRPVWLNEFSRSEATFYSIFNLTDELDRKTMSRFVPEELYSPQTRLSKFHSVWYDVVNGKGGVLAPVPSDAEIIARFERKDEGERRQARML